MTTERANPEWPRCLRTSCFANCADRCSCLDNNEFGNRDCPFYKSREQRAQELCDAEAKRREKARRILHIE